MLKQHTGAGAACQQRLYRFSVVSPAAEQAASPAVPQRLGPCFCTLTRKSVQEDSEHGCRHSSSPRLGPQGCRLCSYLPRHPHLCLTCLGPPWTSGDFRHLEEQARGGKEEKGKTCAATHPMHAVELEAGTYTRPTLHTAYKEAPFQKNNFEVSFFNLYNLIML